MCILHTVLCWIQNTSLVHSFTVYYTKMHKRLQKMNQFIDSTFHLHTILIDAYINVSKTDTIMNEFMFLKEVSYAHQGCICWNKFW